jgi:hypothetical protein
MPLLFSDDRFEDSAVKIILKEDGDDVAVGFFIVIFW